MQFYQTLSIFTRKSMKKFEEEAALQPNPIKLSLNMINRIKKKFGLETSFVLKISVAALRARPYSQIHEIFMRA